MIITIDGLNNDRYPYLLDQMYQLRARVFQDRMGWDVNVRNGREIDEFDELDPAFILCVNENLEVTGCARLLQTTGPHMLSDVFYAILDGEPPIRSATIWESTRFCVDTDWLKLVGNKNAISSTTCELMVGILEYAQASGIEDIITVIDPIMNRVLKRSDNAPYDYVGITADMGRAKALAALIDCTEERINRVRQFAGITGDIFISEPELDRMLMEKQGTVLHKPLERYLDEQVAVAPSQRDRSDTIALKEALEHAASKENAYSH